MKIHFLSDVLIAAASLNLQVPIIRFDSGTLLNNSRASVLLLNLAQWKHDMCTGPFSSSV